MDILGHCPTSTPVAILDVIKGLNGAFFSLFRNHRLARMEVSAETRHGPQGAVSTYPRNQGNASQAPEHKNHACAVHGTDDA